MSHIAVYLRVSTRRQDTRSQEPDLERWLQAYAASTSVRWYRDQASGRTMDRPGWKRLEADMDTGQVAQVLVWRLDRLGRTASGLTALFDKLVARKVGLVSLKDGLDIATPAGRLIANVLASVAAYENEVRAERVIAGQQAARAAGKTWGGSQKGRRLVVTTEQVAIAYRLKSEGVPIAAISRAIGVSRPTVYALLRNGESV
jgi:DNA invertase Pin-like site-specific DNA recombinase